LKIKREVKLGILGAITLLIFIWGINYLKGRDLFARQLTFFVVYEQVNGLIESHPVTINGVKMGQVDRIFFHPDRSGRVVVECMVTREIDIPDNSIAKLAGADLLGGREIVISRGDSPTPISSGDTLSGTVQATLQEEVSRQILPLTKQTENILVQLDTVLEVILFVLSEETQKDITGSISSIRDILANLEKTSETVDDTIEEQARRLASIMENAESISANLRNNNEAISRTLGNFADISDSLATADIARTMNDAGKTLQSFSEIMEKIEKGEGSMGMLLNDDELYKNLESSSKQLDLLLEDMKKNPRNYFNISVFGR